MSTRVVRSLYDFARHRMDVEVVCRCGHRAVLPCLEVLQRFSAKRWPAGIGGMERHFRCSVCGRRPVRVGPMER